MIRITKLFFVCSAATALGIPFVSPRVGFAQAQTAQTAVKPVKPYVSIWGAHSRIDQRSYFLITSRDDWTKLWLRHIGKDPARDFDNRYFYNPDDIPEVDFDACMVIVIFQGKQVNSAGVQAAAVNDDAGQITFRFGHRGYGTASSDPKSHGDDVTPYGFFVMRRSAKPVVLEENVQSYKNQPPIWKEVSRFPER